MSVSVGATDDDAELAPEAAQRTEVLAPADLSTPAPGMRTLVLYHPQGTQTIALQLDRPLVIGRAEPSDVVIDGAGLSRRHARIVATEHGVWIEDLGSTNGTLVNGVVAPLARVGPDDEVSLGEVRAFLHVAAPRVHRAQGVDTHDRFYAALEEEVLRARTLARPLSLVMIRALEPGTSLELWAGWLRARLRQIDRLAPYAAGALEVLLPELEGDKAAESAQAWIDAWALGAEVVAGIAVLGAAAGTADQLLEQARAAAHSATKSARIRHADPARDKAEAGEALIERHPTTRALFQSARRLAKSSVPVLIYGETGTGKELVARTLHEAGPRREKPMRSLNCGAIAPSLLESTLFGHEKGAFTGAEKSVGGIFEQAEGGTVFLDEVAELPVAAQIALLRVVETKSVARLGSTRELPLDVRVVAATNRRLEPLAEEGRFRTDLLYRLNASTLEVPPLRARREEIEPLARLFIEQAAKRDKTPIFALDPAALALLAAYEWPGNVRELRNVIDHATAIADGGTITPEHLAARIRARAAELSPAEVNIDTDPGVSFKDRVRRFEIELMLQALSRAAWNQSEAARLLRMPLRTFTSKLRAYGLKVGTKSA